MADFPVTIKPRSVRISSIHQTNVSVAHSLRQVVSDRGGHRWMFELDFPPMSRADFAPLWAFIVSQRGRFGTFNFTLPEHAALGTMAGTPVVFGEDQSGRTLTVSGFTNSANPPLKAGDFIRIAGSYKAHMVTADLDVSTGTSFPLAIEPALQDTPADAAAVSADGVFRCALTSDSHAVDVSTAAHYGFTLQLVEVLS